MTLAEAEAHFVELWTAGVETAEIARRLGIPKGTVSSRASALVRQGKIQSRPRGGAYPSQRAKARQPLALSDTTETGPVHTPVHTTVQRSTPVQTYALPGVEPPRLSPEERKSGRWNIYRPRWIRQRIEQAAAIERISLSQFFAAALWTLGGHLAETAGGHALTPRQSDVPARVVGGLFCVAMIGLLMLFARGYHTLLLILVGVMCGIGALTFTYARSTTQSGLTIVACIGLLSLLVQGYQTLFLVIVLTICDIGALVFLYYDGSHVWAWWFPDQPFNLTIKRWLRYLLQAVTAAFAYVQARVYINVLTGVDPGNFPTALTALAALNTLVMWLVVIPAVLVVMSVFYAVAMYVAGVREKIGLSETPGISQRRWGFRAFGAFS